MTYATGKGFSIGQMFTIVNKEGIGHSLDVGDVVKFIEDDDSMSPLFKRESDGREQYLSLKCLEVYNPTPAQKLGMVIGQTYKVGDTKDSYPVKGTLLRFKYDDRTDIPKFSVLGNDGEVLEEDQYECLSHLVADADGKPIPADKLGDEPPSVKVKVKGDKTKITFGKILTAAEVAKVLEVVGVK